MTRLLQAREYLGISQDEVAGFLNGTVRDVERWETGWETPDPETLARLSKLYQRPAAWLTGEETPPVPPMTPDTDALRRELAEARADVARLTEERDHWKANHDEMVARNALLRDRPDLPLERTRAYESVTDRLDQLATVTARVEQLETALKPFAGLCGSDNILDPDADHQDQPVADAEEWFRHDGFVLKVGDFRRARAALNGGPNADAS